MGRLILKGIEVYGVRQYCVILNGLTVAAVLVLCDGHASLDGLLSILSLVKTQVSGSVPQFYLSHLTKRFLNANL